MRRALSNGEDMREDLDLAPGTYHLPGGLRISASGVTLDGGGAQLVGDPGSSAGISLEGVHGVTIRNLRINAYEHGIRAQKCSNLTIESVRTRDTGEIPANTDFLDIWRPPASAYGSGILLREVENSLIARNDLQHQMCGLLSYSCRQLRVEDNLSNYCSGFGFHLFGTSDSHFEGNYADFCCRYQPRAGTLGHMGADAAGFLIVHGSCRNTFRRNFARLGGDGFFLAGMTADLDSVPCDDNRFIDNDASYSPNIGFEATFSRGNLFRGNRAFGCNYGFWLGFSSGNLLEKNLIQANRMAGIACENGRDMQVKGNQIWDNRYGLLIWSKAIPTFGGQNVTSQDWLIQSNELRGNVYGIRIAANQDHGFRPYTELTTPTPTRHAIRDNAFVRNQIGIELAEVEKTVLEGNAFEDTTLTDVIGES